MPEFKIPGVEGSIPLWEAIVDPTGPVSCECLSLGCAASAAKRLVDVGWRVIALRNGEVTIEGYDLRALLIDPSAIHMNNGKLYDSHVVYKLGSGLQHPST